MHSTPTNSSLQQQPRDFLRSVENTRSAACACRGWHTTLFPEIVRSSSDMVCVIPNSYITHTIRLKQLHPTNPFFAAHMAFAAHGPVTLAGGYAYPPNPRQELLFCFGPILCVGVVLCIRFFFTRVHCWVISMPACSYPFAPPRSFVVALLYE